MKKKKALGRGLSALFENESDDKKIAEKGRSETDVPSSEKSAYRILEIDLIRPNSNQPRTHFDPEKIQELANSIKNVGIIEPIIVNPKIGENQETVYEVIAGERRLRASKIAGMTTIPVVIKNHNNDDLLEIMLIENLQREDLTPIEEAQSYETLINKQNLTQDKIAERLGKSRSYITNMMRILKAPLAVKKHLVENRLTVSQVRTLMSLPENEMINLADRTVKENLSVRELERLVNSFHDRTKKKSTKTLTAKDPNIEEIEKIYRDRLKTKVTIQPIKNKAGKIIIEYYDYDDLIEILGKINE